MCLWRPSNDFVSRHLPRHNVVYQCTWQKTCEHNYEIYLNHIFLHRSQQQSKLTCPLEFIFQVISSLPKQKALSSTQVTGKQKTESKKQGWMGANTQICVGVGNRAVKVKTYSDSPLCSLGNSKGNPASPPLCPTPDPFTILMVAVVACKNKGKLKNVDSPCWIW